MFREIERKNKEKSITNSQSNRKDAHGGDEFSPISQFAVGDVVITERGHRVKILGTFVRVLHLESKRRIECPPFMAVKKSVRKGRKDGKTSRC